GPVKSACSGVPASGVHPLEDLDRVARPELHDCLLPARPAPAVETAALRLRLHHADVHPQHLDVEKLLDGLPDLRFVRVRMDAERVRVTGLDLRIALLRHDRSEQDFVGMQAHELSAFALESFAAFASTSSSASWVRSTERAHTSAATSSRPGVVTTTRSMLRKDLATFSSSLVTTTAGNSFPHVARSATAARVEGSVNVEPSSTPSVPSAACCERTPRSAERRVLRFTFTSKSRGVGGNATPPPVHCGALVVPARARPVPFCRHGFERPPETSPRLFAARVPLRSAFISARTVSWTTCGFSWAPKTVSSSVRSLAFLPAESKSGAFGAAISDWPPALRRSCS